MFTLSAFADEISPDPLEQIAVLKACGVRFIEFRSIDKTNVLKLSDARLREFKSMLDGEGLGLSAVGSPVGKSLYEADMLDIAKRLLQQAKAKRATNEGRAKSHALQPPRKRVKAGRFACALLHVASRTTR